MRTLLAVALLAANTAAAQAPGAHVAAQPIPSGNGTVFRASVGYGWGGPRMQADSDRVGGLVFSLGAERQIIPRVIGVVEAARWQSGNGASNATFLVGGVSLYPIRGTDGFIRAAFGYGAAHVHAPDIAVNHASYDVNGPALQFGVGYDYRMGPRWTLGGYAMGTNTVGGTAESSVVAGSGEFALVSVGVAARWSWW